MAIGDNPINVSPQQDLSLATPKTNLVPVQHGSQQEKEENATVAKALRIAGAIFLAIASAALIAVGVASFFAVVCLPPVIAIIAVSVGGVSILILGVDGLIALLHKPANKNPIVVIAQPPAPKTDPKSDPEPIKTTGPDPVKATDPEPQAPPASTTPPAPNSGAKVKTVNPPPKEKRTPPELMPKNENERQMQAALKNVVQRFAAARAEDDEDDDGDTIDLDAKPVPPPPPPPQKKVTNRTPSPTVTPPPVNPPPVKLPPQNPPPVTPSPVPAQSTTPPPATPPPVATPAVNPPSAKPTDISVKEEKTLKADKTLVATLQKFEAIKAAQDTDNVCDEWQD